jgi:hypothetical protein
VSLKRTSDTDFLAFCSASFVEKLDNTKFQERRREKSAVKTVKKKQDFLS